MADNKNIVKLDAYESGWAVSVGNYRHQESEKRGKPQSDNSKATNALANHQRGAAAELALCKFLGVPWNATVNTYNSFPDLDGQMEVRSKTDSQNHMRLYRRRDSAKGHYIFVSVTRLGNQRFRIDGWMLGDEAMKSKHLVGEGTLSKQPEWHPPAESLRSPDTLKKEVNRRSEAFKIARAKFQDELRASSGVRRNDNRTENDAMGGC